ncbi:MAG: hypothetical protein ACKOA8_10025 [Deltaproteobacteria bacterium]
MKFLILIWMGVLSFPVFAVLDPASLNSKVFAMYVSTSPYCTSPKLIFSKDIAIFYDVFGFPTLGVTDNKDRSYDGTYSCLIFKISERFTFRPNVTGGDSCLFTSVYTEDFCPQGTQTVGVDGTSISCTNVGDETVFLYLSTASQTNDPDLVSEPFSPPSQGNTSKGIKLNSPVTISGVFSGRLVSDGTGRISASGGSCTMALPKFSFLKE